MFRWTFPAALAILALPFPAAAQSGVDWGSLMQAEATNSAVAEAAREGVPPAPSQASTPRAAPPVDSAERAKANCTRARSWAAEGRKIPELPQLLDLCKQLGL
jgi:hypothetical protein